jgi:hypothetical protein
MIGIKTNSMIKKTQVHCLGIAVLIIGLMPIMVSAQAPKYSNEFLSIGVGARALAMSNSVIASVNDATAGYWNPAGLTNIQGNLQVAAMHSEYFAGIAKYDYGCVATPLDKSSVIAFTLIRFGVDDIPNTLNLVDAAGNVNYNNITSFSVSNYAFMFSYARKSKYIGLTYGANAKIIYQNVGPFANSWGFGLDAGMQYQTGNWKFGAMFRDITTTFNAWSYNTSDLAATFAATGNDIPTNSLEITLPKLLLGIGNQIHIYGKLTAMPELGMDVTFDGQRNVLVSGNPVSIDPHLGIEIGYNNFLFLRAGVGNIQKVTNFDGTLTRTYQPSMGIGIKIKNLTIDYALTNLNGIGANNTATDAGLYSNVFSLKLDFYKHKK